jgi:hypothetical protein
MSAVIRCKITARMRDSVRISLDRPPVADAVQLLAAAVLCCAGEGKWTGFMDGFDGKV